MDGHAESAPESGGLSDLVSFLADTPDEESTDQKEANQAEESTGEEADTEPEANDDSESEESEAEESAEDKEEATTVDRKIKVPDRHEDGTVTEIEVTEKELIASYERQAAFTRKTQALAERETQAVQFLTQKHEEIRANYLQQAELTRAAVVQMAGIKTEAEMAQLANSDPAAWVAENQRQRQINSYLNTLNQQIEGEKQQAQAQAEQRIQQQIKQQFDAAWAELSKDGIDKPKLQKIYGDASSNYGFTDAELANVYDPRLVRVLRDAAAYRTLQAQKPAVMQKVQNAPRMPSRQSAPAQERRDQALEQKFKTGRAKLNDLAAFLR